jgi:hypothetical protein
MIAVTVTRERDSRNAIYWNVQLGRLITPA